MERGQKMKNLYRWLIGPAALILAGCTSGDRPEDNGYRPLVYDYKSAKAAAVRAADASTDFYRMHEFLEKLAARAELEEIKPSEVDAAKDEIFRKWSERIVSPPSRKIRKCYNFQTDDIRSRIALGQDRSVEAILGKKGVFVGQAAPYPMKTARDDYYFAYRYLEPWEKELITKLVKMRFDLPVLGEFDNFPANCD